MSTDSESPPPPESHEKLFFGGLIGLSVAVVLQVLDKKPDLDSPLGWGLYCFALALPMLVASFLLEINSPPRQRRSTPRALFDLAGISLALAGFVLLFFFLNQGAGFLFLAATVVCTLVVFVALRAAR